MGQSNETLSRTPCAPDTLSQPDYLVASGFSCKAGVEELDVAIVEDLYFYGLIKKQTPRGKTFISPDNLRHQYAKSQETRQL